MDHSDLADYARNHAAPIPHSRGGTRYRCAAYLTDGLYLPCVVLASPDLLVDLAIHRFAEAFEGRSRVLGETYRDAVRYFVTSDNRLSHYDIDRLEPSPYAIPIERLAEIRGETTMSWTAFNGIMKDGREFSFGTALPTEFFHMPVGYSGSDIVQVVSHKRTEGEVYRERPFFTCFVKGLEARGSDAAG